MRLPRIRSLKAHRAVAGGQDPAVTAAAVPGLDVTSAAAQVTALPLPLPHRQPKTPQVQTDWKPVDLVVLRKVLDALNERRPLVRRAAVARPVAVFGMPEKGHRP